MRLYEIRQREDFDTVLSRTLSSGWTSRYGRSFTVTVPPAANRSQTWLVQPQLSVYFTTDVGRTGRRFIGDLLRHTPRRLRAPAQWLAVTVLSSRPGLRASSRPGFGVSPAVPHAEWGVVLPGNRRIRHFDLAAQTTCAFLKAGFDAAGMARELRLRTRTEGPFPPVLDYHEEMAWLEEPLIRGFTLPRCPPWRSRRGYEREALALLEEWLQRHARPGPLAAHLATLSAGLAAGFAGLERRFSWGAGVRLKDTVERLTEVAGRLSGFRLSQSHGDFQAGNVLIEASTDRVYLTDWEYTRSRFECYDPLVYGLSARHRRGLAERVTDFVGTGQLGAAGRLLPRRRDVAWRRAAIALFLLEELAWVVEEALSGPFRGVPRGLEQLSRELLRGGGQLARRLQSR